MSKFRYELEKPLLIAVSGESGLAIGRAEFSQSENRYLLRYAANDGRAVEDWWGESALLPIDSSAVAPTVAPVDPADDF